MRLLADLSHRVAITGRGGRRQEAVALLALVLGWLEEGLTFDGSKKVMVHRCF
jgi:hypothetical protein